uniref:Uncharacterized protein n=1 Tax=Rhizophora mucronata TaxID=61149 RepID=A0A2P2NM86_RHIMU
MHKKSSLNQKIWKKPKIKRDRIQMMT